MQLRNHFLRILTPVLELKRLQLLEGASVKGQELTGVRALCRLLALQPPPAPPGPEEEDNDNFSKMRFLFALVSPLPSAYVVLTRSRTNAFRNRCKCFHPLFKPKINIFLQIVTKFNKILTILTKLPLVFIKIIRDTVRSLGRVSN